MTPKFKLNILITAVVAPILLVLFSFTRNSTPPAAQENTIAATQPDFRSEEIFGNNMDESEFDQNPESFDPITNKPITQNPEQKKAAIAVSAELLTPQKEEILTIGQTYTIRWKLSKTISDVRIVIYEPPISQCGYDTSCAAQIGTAVEFLIAESVPNTGSFQWQVGNSIGKSLPASKYNVRIETVEGNSLGVGETFALVASKSEPAQKLELAVPYDPSQMPAHADPLTYSTEFDTLQAVMWSSSPSIFYVDIFIRSKNSSQTLYQIAKNIPNGHLIGWQPNKGDINGRAIPAGEYELYVQDNKNPNVKSHANPFVLQ